VNRPFEKSNVSGLWLIQQSFYGVKWTVKNQLISPRITQRTRKKQKD